MNILQTVKYFSPSKGGMETVVKDLIEGVGKEEDAFKFTVYSNQHFRTFKGMDAGEEDCRILKVSTPILFKSQPLNFRYADLNELIKDNDVIHHHYPFPNMELALVRNIKLLSGKKFIITWHANIENSRWSFIRKFYDPIIRKLLLQAEYIVVTSPQLYEYSELLKEFEHKVRVIPLCLNPRFNGTKATVPYEGIKKILFVGKLRAYKGVTFLIDAIAKINCQLLIVGEGEEKANLINQVEKLNISEKVSFLGKVSDAELTLLYQQADLFVLPSINEAEAFGLVQLEAMAYGLPVINTNLHSGVPYVSLNGVSGLTVEPKNAEALSRSITDILENPEFYDKLAKGSRDRVKLFSIEQMAKKYIALYKS